MRSKGDAEVGVSGHVREPLHAIGGGEDLATVVFNRNRDAVFGGGIGVGFHFLYELFHGRLQGVALKVLSTPGSAHHDLAAEAFDDG